MFPLAIIEIPAPSTLGTAEFDEAFIISKALEPLTELSARRITLPSALILLTFISLSKLAKFTSDLFEPSELAALTLPSTVTLTDFVKSLASLPIPVHIPPSHGPISLPMAPFLTSIFKSLEALIRFASVP